MTCQTVPEPANQHEKRGHGGDESALQPSWCTDANQLPHQQSEIEASGVDQQSLSNIGVSAQVYSAHPSCFVEVRERPFEALAAEPQQAQAPRRANPPTIPVHRVAGLGVLRPVPSAAIGLGDVTADADRFEIHERLIAVIPLVADDLFDPLAIRP